MLAVTSNHIQISPFTLHVLLQSLLYLITADHLKASSHTIKMPSATGQNWEKYKKEFADDEEPEKKITPLTDEDIQVLKTYGAAPYAAALKRLEKEIKEKQASVNEKIGQSFLLSSIHYGLSANALQASRSVKPITLLP